MNKKQAEDIAKKMVKKRVSVYVARHSLTPFNKGKLFTPAAEAKVLTAFWQLVVNSNYPALDKMFAEDKLVDTL